MFFKCGDNEAQKHTSQEQGEERAKAGKGEMMSHRRESKYAVRGTQEQTDSAGKSEMKLGGRGRGVQLAGFATNYPLTP